MKKLSIALASVVAIAVTGSAFAAPPADQDACNTLAFDYAQKAADKKLAKDQALKVDELVTKLEGQCGSGKFAEADATAKEIDAALK